MECPICFLQYNENKVKPISLLCGHSTCIICVDKIDACCICRTSLAAWKLDNYKRLPTNFAILDILRQSHQSNMRKDESGNFWGGDQFRKGGGFSGEGVGGTQGYQFRDAHQQTRQGSNHGSAKATLSKIEMSKIKIDQLLGTFESLKSKIKSSEIAYKNKKTEEMSRIKDQFERLKKAVTESFKNAGKALEETLSQPALDINKCTDLFVEAFNRLIQAKSTLEEKIRMIQIHGDCNLNQNFFHTIEETIKSESEQVSKILQSLPTQFRSVDLTKISSNFVYQVNQIFTGHVPPFSKSSNDDKQNNPPSKPNVKSNNKQENLADFFKKPENQTNATVNQQPQQTKMPKKEPQAPLVYNTKKHEESSWQEVRLPNPQLYTKSDSSFSLEEITKIKKQEIEMMKNAKENAQTKHEKSKDIETRESDKHMYQSIISESSAFNSPQTVLKQSYTPADLSLTISQPVYDDLEDLMYETSYDDGLDDHEDYSDFYDDV